LIHSAGYGYVLVSFPFFCEFNALRQNAMKYATHGASSCLLYGLPLTILLRPVCNCLSKRIIVEGVGENELHLHKQ